MPFFFFYTFQPGVKACHSTETALVNSLKDLLLTADNGDNSIVAFRSACGVPPLSLLITILNYSLFFCTLIWCWVKGNSSMPSVVPFNCGVP